MSISHVQGSAQSRLECNFKVYGLYVQLVQKCFVDALDVERFTNGSYFYYCGLEFIFSLSQISAAC